MEFRKMILDGESLQKVISERQFTFTDFYDSYEPLLRILKIHNSIFSDFDIGFSSFNDSLILENLIFSGNMILHSLTIEKELIINNCLFLGEFEMNACTISNKFELKNCNFNSKVKFFDCNFGLQTIFSNNIFDKGTDIYEYNNAPFANTFLAPLSVNECLGM